MNKTTTTSRQTRIRKKIQAVSDRPRLTVFRSNAHIWAQIVDDKSGKTLVAASDKQLKNPKGTKTELAAQVGELLAEKAKEKKIKKVVFDRGPYKFHGRIKALAEAARQKGLEF